MIEVLIIVSQSWPIAIMFLGLFVLIGYYRMLRYFKQSEERNIATRVSTARNVTPHVDNG